MLYPQSLELHPTLWILLCRASQATQAPPPPGHLVSQVLDGNPYTKFLRKDCDFPVDLEVDLGIRSKQG